MLHAVWNALAKRARDQLVFLWSSVSLASVVLVPVGLLGLPEGGVPAAAVPYVIATIVIHAGYFVTLDRKSTRLNSSHLVISYAVFCLKKKKNKSNQPRMITHVAR